MRTKKTDKLYLPLDDIEEINDKFLNEITRVRTRLAGCDSDELINTFHEVLIAGYKTAVEIKAAERKVDYEIKLAEIEARAAQIKPVRHEWGLLSLFRSPTNRAQDIIEERAELDAELLHDELERQLDADWKKLRPENGVKMSKRERKRLAKQLLNETLKKADEATPSETFEEPPTPPLDVQQPEEPATATTPATTQENATEPAKQLPGQITLDDVQPQAVPQTTTRRPRPPRSCRKP